MNIEMRPAQDEDIPSIVELIADRIGEEDGAEADLVLRDPHFDRRRWLVAADGARVLSTAAVFPGQLQVGAVKLAAGAVEFVATREGFEGQGLVRRLVNEIHHTAPIRGEMVQWIVGITYFYRKFGYEYALPVDGTHLLAADKVPAMPAGWSVRTATEGDVRAIAAAQRGIAARADVAITATDQMWDFYRRSPGYELVVATGSGGPGYGRIYAYEDDRYLVDVVAPNPEAAAALAHRAGGGGHEVAILSRTAVREALDALAPWEGSGDAYYLRVADPVALLEALRPVLSERLRGFEGEGEALISLYESSIRFAYSPGRVGPIQRGGPEHGPIGVGGSGVAPDQIVSLILGSRGAGAMAELHADVNLGDQQDLMLTLFPPQTSDVHSWVVP